MTNAVRHGGQSVCDDRVIMKMAVCDDLLRLEVIDAGMTDSYPAIGGVSAASAEGGRGLFIVSHLTGGAWGFRDLGVGRLVWCEFPADPEASSAAFVPLARTG
ncbi:hypothetical protein FHS22_005189 [Planomonospora venezuelensis]|uniref:Histidine kinase/HSP90-like ATPase domain-containing protein n=1 Tax=Planomonospora venezuelensis TaxID=1999 RepID=A0A841D8T1_PLAVE|nr:hypothetical protein [Planomonospora venezuelensis]